MASSWEIENVESGFSLTYLPLNPAKQTLNSRCIIQTQTSPFNYVNKYEHFSCRNKPCTECVLIFTPGTMYRGVYGALMLTLHALLSIEWYLGVCPLAKFACGQFISCYPVVYVCGGPARPDTCRV